MSGIEGKINPREGFLDRVGPSTKKAMLSGSGLIIMFAVFCFIIPNGAFYDMQNLINISQQVVTYSIIGFGLTFCLICGGTDLSAGASMGLSGIIVLTLLGQGFPLPIAILACLVFGVLMGIINGFSIEVLGVVPFIATLGTQWIFRGIANVLVEGKPVYDKVIEAGALARNAALLEAGTVMESDLIAKAAVVKSQFALLGGGTVSKSFPLPYSVLIMAGLGLILFFVLAKTRVGRQIYACGSNLEAAKLSGINAVRTRMFAYCVSGLCAAVCGILVTSRIKSAQPMAGQGSEMEAIAASVVGGVANTGGEGSIGNTIIGALIMGVLRNGLNLKRIDTFYQNIVIGIILIGACALEAYRHKKNAK